MRPIATDVARDVVCLSVCLASELYKNGLTDRDAVWGLTRVRPRNHVLDGIQILNQKGQFLGGLSGRESGVSAAVYGAKGIIHSSIKASRLLQPTAVLPTGGVTLLRCPSTWAINRKMVQLYSIVVARHALTQKSKGRRSRLHGYENRHGRTVASDACCHGRVLLLPAWVCMSIRLFMFSSCIIIISIHSSSSLA